MIKIDRPVVVEGKYDKITLGNIIDAVIIATDGFRIFKDAEKVEYIRKIAHQKGVIVVTDSDSAGNQIRAYLKNICGIDNITNVYIPKIRGKEKRKNHPGKEGILGVEGMSKDILLNAFEKSGVFCFDNTNIRKVTKQDMFLFGLSGCENCNEKRNSLAKHLGVPTGMSSTGFLDAVNSLYGYDKFVLEVEKWEQDTDKK